MAFRFARKLPRVQITSDNDGENCFLNLKGEKAIEKVFRWFKLYLSVCGEVNLWALGSLKQLRKKIINLKGNGEGVHTEVIK